MIDNELSRVSSYAHLRESVDVTEPGEQGPLVGDRPGARRGRQRPAVLRPRVARAATRSAPASSTTRPRSPATATTWWRCAASRPTRSPSPRSGCSRERGPAAVSAWQTLFGQITSTLEVPFDAGEGDGRRAAHHRPPARARAQPRPRPAPAGAGDALRRASSRTPTRSRTCYDTLVGDRLAMDKLRGYAGPMEPTHLRNELPGPVVEGMLDAVERHYGIAHRWFRHQGRHPRRRAPGAARPVRADRRGPLGRLPRGAAADRRVVRPLLAPHRRDRRRLLRRAPHRRRAAQRASAAGRSAPRSPRTRRPTC